MDVYVIPIGRDRHELYCEPAVESDAEADTVPATGLIGRLRHLFRATLRAVEERPPAPANPADAGAYRRIQDRALGWISARITEQRLLWNLRRCEAAVAVHPEDLSFDEVMRLVRRTLQHDYERHRVWLVVDLIGLILSGPIALIPGPNVLAYYFAFRVVGHWLSMRGAVQGLRRVSWSGRSCPALTELRDVFGLELPARAARVHDIAAQLRLPHLSTFFERVAVRHA